MQERSDFPFHKKMHALDSWRIFRIMAEFVDGFEAMVSLGPSVAFFGSSNATPPSLEYYEKATILAKKIAEKKFGIITGGGPGIMEAANKGAQLAKGKSCGLCINLPNEATPNTFIDEKFHLSHRYFFIRKVMFVRYAQAFVVFPGGFGTLDELFEALTLIQTKKITSFPVFMIGKKYWEGLIDWLSNTVEKKQNIERKDLHLFTLTDDIDLVVEKIEKHYQKNRSLENF